MCTQLETEKIECPQNSHITVSFGNYKNRSTLQQRNVENDMKIETILCATSFDK